MSTSNHPDTAIPKARAWAAALVTVAIWASFLVINRAIATQLTLKPLDIMWARTLGASVLVLPWGFWLVRKLRRQGRHTDSFCGLSPLPWRITVALGIPVGLMFGLLVYTGFTFAPAAHAAVLLPGSLPLWTSLLAVILLGDRLPWPRWVSLGFILLGDALVGGGSLLQAFDGSGVWRGDVLFMLGAISWSLYAVLTRKWAVSALEATVAIVVFACSTFLPAYVLLALMGVIESRLWQVGWLELVFQCVFQGWFSVVISGTTFTYMVRHFGPVRSTMITALVPGLAAMGAVVFLGEPLTVHVMLGLALVTLGIVFGVRQPKLPVLAKLGA